MKTTTPPTLRQAPFTGNLIEMPDRTDRLAFIRTVIHLTREGEFPRTTRVLPCGTFILTTLDNDQIEDVRASIAGSHMEDGVQEPPPEVQPRPRSRPISDELKAIIQARLADGETPGDVARETGLPYQTVFYYVTKARRAKRPGVTV